MRGNAVRIWRCGMGSLRSHTQSTAVSEQFMEIVHTERAYSTGSFAGLFVRSHGLFIRFRDATDLTPLADRIARFLCATISTPIPSWFGAPGASHVVAFGSGASLAATVSDRSMRWMRSS